MDSLKECSPVKVTSHSRWPKLMVAIRNAKNVLTSWKAVFDLCFPRKFQPLHFGVLTNAYCNKSDVQCGYLAKEKDIAVFDPMSCWTYAKHGFEVLSSLEKAFVEEIREFESCASQFIGYSQGLNYLHKPLHSRTE